MASKEDQVLCGTAWIVRIGLNGLTYAPINKQLQQTREDLRVTLAALPRLASVGFCH